MVHYNSKQGQFHTLINTAKGAVIYVKQVKGQFHI